MTEQKSNTLTLAEKRNLQIKQIINSNDIQRRIKSSLSDPQKREKFTAILINVALDDSLSTCSPKSIVKAGLQAAELDLPLNKNMGLAYIVKYKEDAEFQVGYKGWQLLAKRAGIKLNVTPVFDCDEFEMVSDGFDTSVKYVPNLDSQEDHKPEWVNSHLRGVLVSTKENGDVSHKFVGLGKIKQIAGVSPSVRKGSYSPYTQWNLEMYMGKAIKYVLSKMPMQEQIARAVEMENEVDKKRISDNADAEKNAVIIEGELAGNVDKEAFEQVKQNIIKKEVTLQELCDNGFEFTAEQYAELEALENVPNES